MLPWLSFFNRIPLKKTSWFVFLLLGCFIQTYAQGPHLDTPIIDLQFEGDASDETGTHTPAETGITYTNDLFGQSAIFENNNDQISIPTTLIDNQTSFSISFWFKTSGTNTWDTILSGNTAGVDNIRLYLEGGVMKYIIENQTLSGTINVATNTWHHLLYTHNTTTGVSNAWIDGALDNTMNFASGLITTSLLVIGEELDCAAGDGCINPTQAYVGRLDSFRIYDIGLSSGDATAIYQEALVLDPSKSLASVPSPVAGNQVSISLTTYNHFNTQMASGGATVTGSVTGANTTALAITDNSDGTYTATYTPTVAGTDTIALSVNGTSITSSPFIRNVSAGPESAANSSASINNGTAGSSTPLSIQVRDAFNNPTSTANLVVTLKAGSANAVSDTVISTSTSGGGTYSAIYNPTIAGDDIFEITISGTPISGSPFTSTVSPGAASAESTATVPNGTAGSPTTITVQAVDLLGNNISTGGDTVVISITGANTATPAVTDNNDGTYTATYTPTNAGDNSIPTFTGTDNIAITINGLTLNNSPFTSTVSAGPASTTNSLVSINNSFAGGTVSIMVTPRDAFDNPTFNGTFVFTLKAASVNAESDTILSVFSTTPGTLSASYSPTVSGTDIVEVTIDGNHADGSPFSVTISPGSASDQSSATVPAGIAGSPTSLSIQAIDALGNQLITGGDTVTVAITGANTANPTVTDNNDGSYSASYTPTTTGTDTVAIEINGTPLSNSPFSSEVSPGAVDASSSTAVVPDGLVGTTTTITIQARDALGNPRTTGGDTVLAIVRGSNRLDTAVVDEGDGSYTATYTPSNSGSDQITITLNGANISGSPFTSLINGNPMAQDDSVITGVNNAIDISILSNDSDPGRSIDIPTLEVTQPSNGSAQILAGGVVRYTPSLDYSGSDSFTYTFRDDLGVLSNTATVHIVVSNGAVAVDDQLSALFGATTNLDVLANDGAVAGLDLTTVTVTAQPSLGTATANPDGTITYTPTSRANTNDFFSYTVQDNLGVTSSAALVTLSIMNLPLANADSAVVQINTVTQINLSDNDTDPDGNESIDDNSIVIETTPNFGTATANSDGTVEYTPNTDVTGNDSFTYSIADEDGNRSSPGTVSIKINNPPTTVEDTQVVYNNTNNVITVLANDSDSDGTIIPNTVTIVSAPGVGSATANANGTITYTVDRDNWGPTSFTYQVSDNDGGTSAETTVNLNVVVYIPDSNFKNYLLSQFDVLGTPGSIDGEIDGVETVGVTDISCSDLAIRSLEGVAAFSDLRLLHAERNQIITLTDLSPLLQLDEIRLAFNQISDIEGLPPGNAPLAPGSGYESILDFSNNRLPQQPILVDHHYETVLLNDNQGSGGTHTTRAISLVRYTEYTDISKVSSTTTTFESCGTGASCITGEREQRKNRTGGSSLININLADNIALDIDPEILPDTLKTLNLNNNNFLNLPDFSQEPILADLGIAGNLINEIPIANLPPSLESIDLSGLHLRTQMNLSGFTSLEYLDLDDNRFGSINPTLLPTSLVTFIMSGSGVNTQPDLSSFTNMTYLDMSDNRLRSIDPALLPPNLTYLDVSGNLLTAVPPLSPPRGSALTVLNLANNKLSSLNTALLPSGLTQLNLANNQLPSLGDLSGLLTLVSFIANNNLLTSIGNLPSNLQELNLDSNRLSNTPDFSALTNLQKLYLGKNQLSSGPDLSNQTLLIVLDISQNQLISWPQALSNTSLILLNLEDNQLTGSTPLPNSLEELHLGDNPLGQTPDVSNLSDLRILNLNNSNLSDFPDLSLLSKLKTFLGKNNGFQQIDNGTDLLLPSSIAILDLENNQLTDLPLISGFDFLVELHLGNNQLTSLPAVLPVSLNLLDLSNNQFTSLPNLSSFLRLNNLDLSGNQIPEIPSNRLPSNLSSLNLSNNHLSSTGDLRLITGLSILDLGNNQLSGLNSNELPPTLQNLNINNNQISQLGDFSLFPLLETITISNNQLNEINPDHLPPVLGNLDLSGNQINNLPDLSTFPVLQEISLAGNQLTGLDGNLLPEALLNLNLQGNQVTDVSNMDGLSELEEINLGGNTLGSLNSLPPNLRHLGLQGSGVTDLPILGSLTSLQTVNLTGNTLVSLPDLSTLENLTNLNLNGNQFEDLSFLPPNLEEISFEGNDVDPSTLPGLAFLEVLCYARAGLTSIPDLSGFPSMNTLDLSWNELDDLTGFPGELTIGSQAHHVLKLEQNNFGLDDCNELIAIKAVTDASGASFTFRQQGNLDLMLPFMAAWQEPTSENYNILDLVEILNSNAFGYSLNCPE